MTHCYICGSGLARGESYLANGRHTVCLACADTVSVEGLGLLTDTATPREMLLSLGFWWDVN